jgi:hypothetical protein
MIPSELRDIMTSKDLQRVLVNSASGEGEREAETSGGSGEQMVAESEQCWD